MPNPSVIHPRSSRTEHFLGIADIYIGLGQPKIFEVEPNICEDYRPDAYTIVDGTPIIIEYQRTQISLAKMQDKVDRFVASYHRRAHNSTTLWIIGSHEYPVRVPVGFTVVQRKKDAAS